MVSSRYFNGSEACAQKASKPQQHIPADCDEVDFSDVFGPVPIQASIELKYKDTADIFVGSNEQDCEHGDHTAVVYNSQILVGPIKCISPSPLKLDELTLLETKIRDTGEPVDAVSKVAPKASKTSDSEKSIGLEDFEVLKVVGQGAFGKVYQVRKRDNLKIYAMKVVRKDKVIEKDQTSYMQAERDVLSKIDHPFIVRLRYSFQTKYRLYLVMDFVNGGHLLFQLRRQGLFREELARIYAAEIVSAVSHLHKNSIMHRDLKPQNVLLDADGHVMLTDFGLAKEFDETTRSNSLCGTTEYMPPEILLGKGHDKAADWWSVGILLYEMLTGKLPFSGKNRQVIQHKILKDKLKLPSFLSSEGHSLLKGLLRKEPNIRLGSGNFGCEELKSHKWFKCINWKKLEARQLQPSFLPQVLGKDCVANFDEEWTSMPLQDSPATTPKDGTNPFKGFTFIGTEDHVPQSEIIHQFK
uniref:non-specific serine/threonine protein kinase n=1 Tax=Kalanchoe fedtschenkoi TaxID=63787 RepID=A0A7N0UPH7_KALFE